MLERLRNLNLDRILDDDEAVVLSAFARNLYNEFGHLDIEPPEWLAKSTTALRDEINRRRRAADEALLKEIDAEIESYKSKDEKRTSAEQRRDALRNRLGLAAAK